jgi:predicted Fe-Mo cluster-binding NifX family protein
MEKLLIPVQGDFVAPRFDLATEIIIAEFDKNGQMSGKPKTIIMERASDDELCQMIVDLNITDVICGGIGEQHYNFLIWKKVTVYDSIIANWQIAVEQASAGALEAGAILTIENGWRLDT